MRFLATLLAVAALAILAGPTSARAGTWTALQCGSGNWSHEATAVSAGALNGYTLTDTCSSADRELGMYSYGASGNAAFSQWQFTPPNGTYFSRVRASADTNSGENYSVLLTRPRGGGSAAVFGSSESGGYQEMDSGNVVAGEFGVRLACNRPSNCAGSLQEWTRARDFRMTVVDDNPPTAPTVSGNLVAAGWKSGSASVNAALSDVGGGVAFDWMLVNGVLAEQQIQCDPEMAGSYTTKLKPCPSTASHATSMNTAAGSWQEGTNSVSVCTFEYGAGFDGPGCRNLSVNVDNVAPAAVSELEVNDVEETEWTAANSFDLAWTNPVQNSSESPLSALYYRVRETGGSYDSGRQVVPGGNVEEIQDLAMPHAGRYEVSVWWGDESGNADEVNARLVTVKFDDTEPALTRPDAANGWLSRQDFTMPYQLGWERPSALTTPPSGIHGYAVVVDQVPNTDPCDVAGTGGASAACGDDEITHPGIDNISTVFDDLPEGSSYVHVVAVSGSGVKSSEIGHTELRVDKTDPEATLEGLPSTEWANSDVGLVADAVDERSGMTDTDEYPGDSPPRTVIESDGVAVEDADGSVSHTISSEGTHLVRYWARDLAGNENDGLGANAAPAVATVKLDKTAPTVAFTNGQSPVEPNVFRAPFADALSGVVSGEIALRKVGTDDWIGLPTQIRGDQLVAAADDSKLERDASYQFRATVTDKAGNTTTTSKRQDGSDLVAKAPFKAETAIRDLSISGRAKKVRLGYSKQARVTGRLVSRDGEAIAGAPVVITEGYGPGAKTSRPKLVRATTGSGGVFDLELPKGPSRSITVGGVETDQLLAPAEQMLRAVVEGKVSLKATPERIKAGNVLQFRGKVSHRKARVPKGGKRVEIQVRIGKRWDVVGRSFQTRKNGAFTLNRRLGRFYTRPTTFVFRAAVLKEGGWAYRAPTYSKKLRVTVVPR